MVDYDNTPHRDTHTRTGMQTEYETDGQMDG